MRRNNEKKEERTRKAQNYANEKDITKRAGF